MFSPADIPSSELDVRASKIGAAMKGHLKKLYPLNLAGHQPMVRILWEATYSI